MSSTTCKGDTSTGRSSQYWSMKEWKTLLLSIVLERSTGFGRVEASSNKDLVSMFFTVILFSEICIMALVDEMLLGRIRFSSCFPILGSVEFFMFRWSIIAIREDRSRLLLLLSTFFLLLFFEEDPDFLLGGFVFFRAILSQRWRWPRMRSSCEYAAGRRKR